MNTLKLWLEPDKDIPEFARLKWTTIDVPFRDVLMNGIHPYDIPNAHPSAAESIIRKMNDGSNKIVDLESAGYSLDLSMVQGFSHQGISRTEQTLNQIESNICFTDSLSYLELMGIAERRLKKRWNNLTVRELAKRAHFGFPALRQFLKSKDKSLKLSGYSDLERYDLSKVLSLDDFRGHDRLLLNDSIPTLNFRRMSSLDRITDDHGRLKLTSEITEFTLTQINSGDVFNGLVWRCYRKGDMVALHPNLEGVRQNRDEARKFARQWRTNDGRMCFETSLDKVVDIVERGYAVATFPSLDYTARRPLQKATVVHRRERVDAYTIGSVLPRQVTVEWLRGILKYYGVPMTGNKKVLFEKLAKLASDEYKKHMPELDSYFSKHRFIIASHKQHRLHPFEVLGDVTHLQNMLLTMYAMRHLRGNAILEASHENDTYGVEDLATALLESKVELNGMFLPVTM